MNDLIEQEVEDVEDLTPEEEIDGEEGGEDTVAAAEPEPDPEAETEARKYGWKPKSEFTLAPDGWVDAKRFLELPSTEVKRLRDELRQRDTGFAERLERLDSANKAAMSRALEQEREKHKQAVAEIQRQQREAVENGDVERYDALERQRSNMKPPEAPQEQQQAGPAPEVVDYRQKNEWAQDPALWAEAAQAVNYMPDFQKATPAQQLQYAENVMRRKYPHMFQAQQEQPKPRNRVDGGGLGGGNRGKGVNALPGEALAAAKEFVEQGVYKSVEDYAKDYWAQEQ